MTDDQKAMERERRDFHNPSLPGTPDSEFDLSKVKPIKHNWVKRGEVNGKVKMSCEGADHPYHFAFTR